MTRLVEFQVDGDNSILVEVEDVASDELTPAAKIPGNIAFPSEKTFGEALDRIQPMIRQIKQKLDAATQSADELEVKFSVKLSGEVGAVLTKVGGEATYEITLRWQNK